MAQPADAELDLINLAMASTNDIFNAEVFDGQAPNELVVKYVVYWKQEDGRCKRHVDIRNTNS